MDTDCVTPCSAQRQEVGRRMVLLGGCAALFTLVLVQPQRGGADFAGMGGGTSITRHHELLAQLLNDMLAEPRPARDLDTAQRIRYLVSAHLYAEEHSLYPLAHRMGLLDGAPQAFPDHAHQTLQAAEVERLLLAGDKAGARNAARALRDQVVQHSAEEERGIYQAVLERHGSEVGHLYDRAFASVRPEKVRWLP